MTRFGQNHSRIFYSGSYHRHGPHTQQPKNVGELISCVDDERRKGARGVCIIENVTSEMFRELCDAWSIDIQVLDAHASNPVVDGLWSRLEEQIKGPDDRKFHCLDGFYEYHNIKWSANYIQTINPNHCNRHFFQQDPYPPTSNTRVTYCRPLPHICMIRLTHSSSSDG